MDPNILIIKCNRIAVLTTEAKNTKAEGKRERLMGKHLPEVD